MGVGHRAVVQVLNAIYETDFLGFSYGYRPGRNPHQALDALTVGIERRKVNWVLDADIRGFFDALDHGWLVKFLEHRVADRRVVRLIQKWLRAGVLEEGKADTGGDGHRTGGGSVSPLLANVYLHYVFDLWVQRWRQRQARGDVIVVRSADDFVVGFEHRHEAERFLQQLRERFAQFGLELHPDKTRLIEFGRFADSNRRGRGGGKPETFDFLGFTHSRLLASYPQAVSTGRPQRLDVLDLIPCCVPSASSEGALRSLRFVRKWTTSRIEAAWRALRGREN